MRESQAEIRAIQAKLRSIHAENQAPTASRSQIFHPSPPLQNSRTQMDVARPSASHTTRAGAYTTRRITSQVDPWEPDTASFTSPTPIYPPQIDLPPLQPAQLQPNHQLQRSSTQPDPDLDRIDWEPVRTVQRSPEPITPQGDRLQQKSIQKPMRQKSVQQKSMQHLQQLARSVQVAPTAPPVIPPTIPSIIPATIPPTNQIDVALQRLEKQAQHINQLAATQEAAILELKAIAEQIEQDWKAIELDNAARAGYDASTLEIPSLCEYQAASLPQVEKNKAGVLVLTARSIDLFKAEREAALTAQALRHRLPAQFQSQPNWICRLSQLRQWILGTGESEKLTQSLASQSLSNQVRRRKPPGFNRREGMTLLIGAVLVRVLLNLLLSAHPGLWFPAITLMVTPGAIALYRSTVTPRSTLTWGYRLIAIMLGFWIGGKLW